MKTRYASYLNDGLAFSARNHLIRTGVTIHTIGSDCPVTKILETEEFKEGVVKLVLLFESPGRYPSNHYRILIRKDVEYQGFVIPEWAPPWGSYPTDRVVYVALRRHEQPKPIENFRMAIDDIYYITSGAKRPKSAKKKAGGYRQRKVRELSSERSAESHPAK
jgi:hypothetical protein